MIKIYKYGEVSNEEIFARENIASNVEGIVSEIIANVIKNGDKALYEYPLTMTVATGGKKLKASQDDKVLEIRYDGDKAYIDFCPFGGPISIR